MFLTYFSIIMSILHEYPAPLRIGNLVTRYKRFLADVNLNDEMKTVHCPNTGSMLGLLPTETSTRLCACTTAPAESKRKYEHTLEMIKDGNTWVGIHSAFANKLVLSCIEKNLIEEFKGYNEIRREVSVASDTRLDFEILWTQNKNIENLTSSNISDNIDSVNQLNVNNKKSKRQKISTAKSTKKDILESMHITRRILMEVKSVTLSIYDSASNTYNSQFPDCISVRAQKHCQHLITHQQKGGESAIVFLIQRDDCTSFSISPYDVQYGKLISQAARLGVLILPYQVRLDPYNGTISFMGKIPFIDTYKDYDIL